MSKNKDFLVKIENSICTLPLNRAGKRNSLTRKTLELLRDEISRLEKNRFRKKTRNS